MNLTDLRNYLRTSRPEIKAVFDLMEKSSLTESYRLQRYQLLKSINEAWPTADTERKKYFASLLLQTKNELPAMERIKWETSFTGILVDTWKLTIKDIAKIPGIAFNILKWLPFIAVGLVGGSAYIGYRFLTKSEAGKELQRRILDLVPFLRMIK